MYKILCVILVFALITGVTFSNALSVSTQTISNIENAFTSVSDRFGLGLFSGYSDLLPDSDGTFNLGYYTFADEQIPVWDYIHGIIGNGLTSSGLNVKSVSPNMYTLKYMDNSRYLYDSFVRVQVEGLIYDFIPVTGYIYFELSYEIAYFSKSYVTNLKRVELGSGFMDRLTIILPNPASNAEVVEQTEITVNEYVNNLID